MTGEGVGPSDSEVPVVDNFPARGTDLYIRSRDGVQGYISADGSHFDVAAFNVGESNRATQGFYVHVCV